MGQIEVEIIILHALYHNIPKATPLALPVIMFVLIGIITLLVFYISAPTKEELEPFPLIAVVLGSVLGMIFLVLGVLMGILLYRCCCPPLLAADDCSSEATESTESDYYGAKPQVLHWITRPLVVQMPAAPSPYYSAQPVPRPAPQNPAVVSHSGVSQYWHWYVS